MSTGARYLNFCAEIMAESRRNPEIAGQYHGEGIRRSSLIGSPWTDLICDLGHLAEERGFDFLSEVRRGIGHWYAEQHVQDGRNLGPDAAVEITINPR